MVGATKMRATTSFGVPSGDAACTMGATVETSSADNQLMIAPSASRPAIFNIPSRRAATRIGTLPSGTGTPSRNPWLENPVPSMSVLAPVRASFRKRTVSRVRR